MRAKNILLLFITGLSLVCFPHMNLQAQSGTVRGFVYEAETGEPVIFTNVYLYKTSIGAVTDVNGYFAITKIPVGQYTLMVS